MKMHKIGWLVMVRGHPKVTKYSAVPFGAY